MRLSPLRSPLFTIPLALAAFSIRAQGDQGAAPSTQPSGRTSQQMIADLGPVVRGILPVYTAHRDWSNAAKRENLSTIAQPHLKKGMALLKEMIRIDAAREGDADLILEMSNLFGDSDTQAQAVAMTNESSPQSGWAKAAKLAGDFYRADGDAAVQNKVVDRFEALAKSDPAARTSLIWAAVDVYSNAQPSKSVADRLDSLVTTTLKSDELTRRKADLEKKSSADAKQTSLVNRPLVLTGCLRDGTAFTSADLKGKVILVDFWASWCGPCKAELPRVKKMYADYHDKGLEVIGVSCDNKAEDLAAYLDKNPDMPWPQLFDKTKPGWHALTKQFGINAIPTMYLIDKNGVCRSVKAREDFEKVIPQLLNESALH